jgi:hypothetical protein
MRLQIDCIAWALEKIEVNRILVDRIEAGHCYRRTTGKPYLHAHVHFDSFLHPFLQYYYICLAIAKLVHSIEDVSWLIRVHKKYGNVRIC